ncbi:GHKL domain-containing protein [Heliobacterium chlorum]|uniref:GHKL domain-containing protein n=1 Tax=Heliobacterium chlorum TaxID=2698 RepID=A0ABR7T6P9_HELCL|nr:GHKL domain-containing protein [Heliobacterium chlorum]MBC9785366.1 GHKL domain-containing protein [Heliobacterium chlorum]
MEDLRVLFFYQIFEPAISLIPGLVLMGQQVSRKRLCIYSIITGIIAWLIRGILSQYLFGLHVIPLVFISIVNAFVILNIPIGYAITTVVLGLSLIACMEAFIMPFETELFGNMPYVLINSSTHIVGGWMTLAAIIILTMIIQVVKKKVENKALVAITDIPLDEKVKKLEANVQMVITCIALMLFIVIYLIMFFSNWSKYFFGEEANVSNMVRTVGAGTIVLTITIIIMISKIMTMYRTALHSVELEQNLEKSKLLVDQYRKNQHEFLNHLQVIFGFIQIQKPEMALEYIKEYDIRYRQGIHIGKIARADVGAILVSKMSSRIGETTKFIMNFEDDLSGIPIKSNEMVSLLGNLLQNALEAVQKVEESERFIEIETKRADKATTIRVSNSGPVIPAAMVGKIFVFGVSSKDNPNSGVGLSLVKSITEKYHGTIRVDSNDVKTTFLVTLPDVTNVTT